MWHPAYLASQTWIRQALDQPACFYDPAVPRSMRKGSPSYGPAAIDGDGGGAFAYGRALVPSLLIALFDLMKTDWS